MLKVGSLYKFNVEKYQNSFIKEPYLILSDRTKTLGQRITFIDPNAIILFLGVEGELYPNSFKKTNRNFCFLYDAKVFLAPISYTSFFIELDV